MFDQAADDMETTGFANMCPVGSVAAEVADTVEDLRRVAGEIFEGWITGGTAYFAARGVDERRARDLTTAVIGGLEGAFLVARTLRSVEPLRAAGRVLAPQYRGIALTRVSLPSKVGTRR